MHGPDWILLFKYWLLDYLLNNQTKKILDFLFFLKGSWLHTFIQFDKAGDHSCYTESLPQTIHFYSGENTQILLLAYSGKEKKKEKEKKDAGEVLG